MKKITFGLLAGGQDSWCQDLTVDGSLYKAMLGIHGRPMWKIVADALPKADQTIVVGEWIEQDQLSDGRQMLRGTNSLLGNMVKIIENAKTEMILFITCDLPALTDVAVNDFIDQCNSYPKMGIGGVVVTRESCMEQFSEVPRTFVKLKEGEVTFGNLIMMRRSIIHHHFDQIREAYDLRKSPLALASMLGFGFIVKFLLAQIYPPFLSLDSVVQRLTDTLGVDVRLFESKYPEVAEDIDKPKHLLPMLAALE